MAKLRKGILGGISGKIGPVVGATWKNVTYVRQHPKKKGKKRPRTAAQLANQKKFTFIQQWLVPFYPYITVGFAKLAIDQIEVNAAFSANYKTAFSGVWPDIIVDHSKILISVGDLKGLHYVEIQRIAAVKLELNWERSAVRNVSFDDQLMLVVYCPELKMTDGFIGGVKRNALKCSFDFDEQMAEHAVEVYLSVTSSDRKEIAESIYLGRLEP
ncbi:MAG: DUF6266 family protein [Candidatus Pedobacter colombiensis]|uniref:DUF6266 family protein n=1 Tax=Candidatus Pedobacter colombiensis TaxID=3121371 RepID=A0AAJ5WBX1_9SPHI|nr:DUF6266 family protein [Pedobacter sp.]WEK21639.1 MAG: DUF6266 family protein [Pedobacter sp.]